MRISLDSAAGSGSISDSDSVTTGASTAGFAVSSVLISASDSTAGSGASAVSIKGSAGSVTAGSVTAGSVTAGSVTAGSVTGGSVTGGTSTGVWLGISSALAGRRRPRRISTVAFDGGSTMIQGRPIFSKRSRIFNSTPASTLAMDPQHRIGLGRPSAPIDLAFGARTSVGETIRAMSPSISTASLTRTRPLMFASDPSSATTALRSRILVTRTGSPSAMVFTV